MKKSKKQKRNFFLIYIFLPNFKLGKKVKKGEGKGIEQAPPSRLLKVIEGIGGVTESDSLFAKELL